MAFPLSTLGPVGAIAHNIQLAVAPVFLLSGIAGILNVLTTRLGRVVDRARRLEADIASYDPTLNIETPSSWKVLPKSLAEGEVAAMLERTGAAARVADADGLALRDHAILELLYAGG